MITHSQAPYKAMLRVLRQWRKLKSLKWNGFGHKDGVVGQGDFAVDCPTCPYPGVNLPETWQADPEKSVSSKLQESHTNRVRSRWKYARAIAFDGNFTAQHRKPKNPDDDVRLSDGRAFMVTDAPYREHLAEARQNKPPVRRYDVVIGVSTIIADLR